MDGISIYKILNCFIIFQHNSLNELGLKNVINKTESNLKSSIWSSTNVKQTSLNCCLKWKFLIFKLVPNEMNKTRLIQMKFIKVYMVSDNLLGFFIYFYFFELNWIEFYISELTLDIMTRLTDFNFNWVTIIERHWLCNKFSLKFRKDVNELFIYKIYKTCKKK